MQTPKKVVRELEKAQPGSRFQRLYRKRSQSHHGKLKNALFILAGLAVIGVGVLTYAVPFIPSEPILLIGIVLLAQGSRWGARALDWTELRFRRHFGWLIKKWRPLPGGVKIAIWLAWTALAGALAYALYRAFS